MIWVIIAFLVIAIELCIITDTHYEVRTNTKVSTPILEEGDFYPPVWLLIFIVISGSIPIINIFLLFSLTIIYNIGIEDGSELITFRLNGKNLFTKSLLKIKRYLNKRI